MLANARWMQSTRHPREGGDPVLREGGDPVLESARYLQASGLRGSDGRYRCRWRLSSLLYK